MKSKYKVEASWENGNSYLTQKEVFVITWNYNLLKFFSNFGQELKEYKIKWLKEWKRHLKTLEK